MDSGDSNLLTISHLLGKGKASLVFLALNSDGERVCLKLEPLSNSAQLRNEISTLDQLRSCEGVPRILCHGIVEFRGSQYCALVTGKTSVWLSLQFRSYRTNLTSGFTAFLK
jgi:predicted Ser/Thr protein kinase